MSKAEDRARSLGYGTDPLNRAEYTANEVREAFIDGYYQAEKDLGLSWKDIKEICVQSVLVEVDLGGLVSDERHYTEVLKRFKDFKERKENGTK